VTTSGAVDDLGGVLRGRRAVVTGGSRGIGRAIAESFAQSGAQVAIWGRSLDSLAVAADEFGGTAVSCDVTSSTSVAEAVDATVSALGGIDVLVANAGQPGESVPFLDVDEAMWTSIIDTNLTGTWRCIRSVVPSMIEAKGGKIIIIASVGAVTGMSRAPAYGASKAGLLGLMRSAAAALARYDIQCNAVLPGWIETAMTEPELGNPAVRSRLEDRTLARRMGSPDEITGVCTYLASRSSSFHTGDVIRVDGGYLTA
jgi:NAD(P)-dependent dehydrogenase (short-subunit alcohol dehydrogenase family)